MKLSPLIFVSQRFNILYIYTIQKKQNTESSPGYVPHGSKV